MKKENATAYSAEQLQAAEHTVMQIAAMPKKTRLIAVMVANAYMDGLLAGQALRDEEKTGREVLANQ